MTKKELRTFAKERGFSAHYSGRLRKMFFRKVFKMDVHTLINNKHERQT